MLLMVIDILSLQISPHSFTYLLEDSTPQKGCLFVFSEIHIFKKDQNRTTISCRLGSFVNHEAQTHQWQHPSSTVPSS